MKKILLIGDSIRMSYQEAVKGKLADVAEVWAPAENCRFAKYTLWSVPGWLRECGRPDLIHWNNGIWDAFRVTPEMGLFTPLAEYVATLKRVLAELRKTDAVILWASTTPTKPGCASCHDEDVVAYNAAAARLMASEGIPINDLHALLAPEAERFVGEDKFHLSAAGVEACAEAVAQAIRTRL